LPISAPFFPESPSPERTGAQPTSSLPLPLRILPPPLLSRISTCKKYEYSWHLWNELNVKVCMFHYLALCISFGNCLSATYCIACIELKL
jgi:hypothetical protein